MSNPLSIRPSAGRDVSPPKVQRSIPIGTSPAGVQDPSIRDAGTIMRRRQNWETGKETGPKFLRERVQAQRDADLRRLYGDLMPAPPTKKRGK